MGPRPPVPSRIARSPSPRLHSAAFAASRRVQTTLACLSLVVACCGDGDERPQTPDLQVFLEPGPAGSDLDLHLVQVGHELYQEPFDCCWCNANPDWGVKAENADDPVLVLYDRAADLPEILTLWMAPEGSYEVLVHAYRVDQPGPPEIALFLSGQEVYKDTLNLEQNEVLLVGTVSFPDGGFNLAGDAPAPSPRRACFR